jgi:molybdopterin-guanine dinucleotide biosynthesis protein
LDEIILKGNELDLGPIQVVDLSEENRRMIMSEVSDPILPMPRSNEKIKWAYAMARIPNLPSTWQEATECVKMDLAPPRANDILVSQVVNIGRHTRLDLRDTSKSKLFVGDLVGLVLSPRYATGQFQARIPETLEPVHFVCAGGVCGQVSGIPAEMKQPTLLRPLGYLVNEQGRRVQLGDHALAAGRPNTKGTQVLCVVGSAMDSGKTTAAFCLINGLARAGLRVGAAKITGTASAKDLTYFEAAGAVRVLDFTNAGYGATADLGPEQLEDVADRILCDLMLDKPDVIVLEIADGVTQRETEMLLDLFAKNNTLDKMLYTCNDALGVASGVDRLADRGLPICGVSGMVTRSALSTREAQRETNLPVYTRDQLLCPDIASKLFGEQPSPVIETVHTNGVLAG